MDHDSMEHRRKRHMTGKDKSKRHEIAEAIHRDDQSMPMEKKMKIATSAAMRGKHR